jgi:magnesium-transporting ATPase (P-type)
VSIASLGVFRWAIGNDWSTESSRGAALTVFMLAQMVLLVSTRSSRLPMWRVWTRPTRQLITAWIALLATVVLMLTVPALSTLLAVAPFELTAVLPLVALVLVSTAWPEAVKQIRQ